MASKVIGSRIWFCSVVSPGREASSPLSVVPVTSVPGVIVCPGVSPVLASQSAPSQGVVPS